MIKEMTRVKGGGSLIWMRNDVFNLLVIFILLKEEDKICNVASSKQSICTSCSVSLTSRTDRLMIKKQKLVHNMGKGQVQKQKTKESK